MALSTAVPVGKASTKVYKPSSKEAFTEIILTNDSAQPMYLNRLGGKAVLHEGVRLNGEGGTLILDSKQDQEIQAISTIEGATLLVHIQ